VVWAIWLIGLFYLFTLGSATARARWSAPTRSRRRRRGNSAAPLLAYALADCALGINAAVAFATILAVVAGLTITASASFVHDIYANVIKRGRWTGKEEESGSRDDRGGDRDRGNPRRDPGQRSQNIAFLVALAFAVAASANLPTILYSLFRKRFNHPAPDAASTRAGDHRWY